MGLYMPAAFLEVSLCFRELSEERAAARQFPLKKNRLCGSSLNITAWPWEKKQEVHLTQILTGRNWPVKPSRVHRKATEIQHKKALTFIFKTPGAAREKNFGSSIKLVNSTVHFRCKGIIYLLGGDKKKKKGEKGQIFHKWLFSWRRWANVSQLPWCAIFIH